MNLTVQEGHEEVIHALLDHGFSLSAKVRGSTPLEIAIDLNYPRIIQVLIDRGASVHERSQVEGPVFNVPLLRAVVHNTTDDVDCVRVLLNAGTDPRVMDQDFNTPLGTSTTMNRKNLVQTFLEFGVDVNDTIDE